VRLRLPPPAGPPKPSSLTLEPLARRFRVPSACTHESPADLSSRPLYNRTNAFFTSASCAELLAQVPDDSPDKRELEALWSEVRTVYGELSGTYQSKKGDKGIPMA